MRQIKIEEVGEILNKLYDSEINIAISSFWDGGYNYTLEVMPYYEQNINITTDIKDITEFIQLVTSDVLIKYPDSKFTKWFKSEYEV